MPGRVCRHYLGSAINRAEGTDRYMEPDREECSAGPACLRDAQLWETQLRAAQIRDEWRRRSLATGWRMPDDWDSEAVEEVLGACRNRALARGEAGLAAAGAPVLTAASAALAAACAGLGRSRARAGVGVAETIDDLAALFAALGAVLGEGEGRQWDPPLRLVGAIAEGWAEESVSQFAHVGCEDPLSGLATLSYLRTRLAEVYRRPNRAATARPKPTGCSWSGCRAVRTRGVAWPCPSWSAATCGPPSPAGRHSPWPSRAPPSPWFRPEATCRSATPGCGETSRPRSAPRSA